MTTTVVNVRLHDYDVYVGRAGHGQDGYFGNPFKLNKNESRGATIDRFRDHFYERIEEDAEFKARIRSLKGKRLGCFCVESPWVVGDVGMFICHAQVIAHYLETTED